MIDHYHNVIYNSIVSKKHKLFGVFLKKQNARAILVGLFCLLVLSGSLIGLFPGRAHAAAQKTPRELATIYQVGTALANCSRDAGWDSPQTKTELNNGSLFNDSRDVTDFSGDPKTVGYLVDPTQDGTIKCADEADIKMMFNILNVSPFDFLMDAGIYKLIGNGPAYEIVKDHAAGASAIKAALEAKYPDLKFGNGLSKAQKYIVAKAAFDKKCKKEEGGGVKVWYIDTQGNGTDKQRSFVIEGNNTVVEVGYGLGDKQKYNCEEVAGFMNANYEAYSKEMKALVAAGVDTTAGGTINGQTGENSNATCEASGLNLSWILCPVYNGVAEVTEWFYNQILGPFLYSPPVDTDPTSNSFKAWASFRLYGNVFIIIALLVVVFGQSIGGGLIDAYTAKKIVPRIVAAAILINISIYIVAFMVDLSNIAGKGISAILLAPFGDLTFAATNGAQGGALVLTVLSTIIGAGGLVGFVGALLTGGAGPVIIMVMFTIVIPALIALIGVFATLVIRRGILLALILVSPVAFALYCLPNTEKYFKKWWELLFKTLLVYPIIMFIFAISNILSLTIVNNNQGAISEGIAGIVALAAQIIPLFMVPFAFKIAGGAMGTLFAAIQNGGQKAGGLLKTRQERSKKDAHQAAIQARMRAYGSLGQRADAAEVNGQAGRRSAYRFLKSRVGGYNLHEEHARINAENMKAAEDQKNSGIDDEQRALTVNKAWALAQAGGEGVHWRMNSAGTGREFKTLGGKWVSETNVDSAHERWDGNQSMLQWSLGYEMSKATTQEQQDYLYQSYGRVGQQGSGFNLNDGEMGGLWTGAAFSKQNTDRQWKHYGWNGENGGQLQANGLALMEEIDERQGNYAMSQQHAETWTTMREEYGRAQQVLAARDAGAEVSAEEVAYAEDVSHRATRIANSFATNAPVLPGGQVGDADGQPVPAMPQAGQQAAGSTDRWLVTPTGAAPRAQEELSKFVTDVLNGPNTPPDQRVNIRNHPTYGAGDDGLDTRQGPNGPGTTSTSPAGGPPAPGGTQRPGRTS